MLWQNIANLTGCQIVPAPAGCGDAYLLPTPRRKGLKRSFWMIGEYRHQKKLATALRNDAELQEFVTDCRVRFGLRETDRPPVDVERQERFGAFKKGANFSKDFVKRRLRTLAEPVDEETAAATNRRTDREQNVLAYWQTQTPQSHHIVEYNHLRDMNVSRAGSVAEMDKERLPCVLLAAEFHQFYLTQILAPTRGQGNAQLRQSLPDTYKLLYTRRGPLFEPLWEVSKLILREVKVTVA